MLVVTDFVCVIMTGHVTRQVGCSRVPNENTEILLLSQYFLLYHSRDLPCEALVINFFMQGDFFAKLQQAQPITLTLYFKVESS